MGKPFPAYTLLYVRLNPSSHVFGIFKQQTLKQDNRACMGEGQHVWEKKIFFLIQGFQSWVIEKYLFSQALPAKHCLLPMFFFLSILDTAPFFSCGKQLLRDLPPNKPRTDIQNHQHKQTNSITAPCRLCHRISEQLNIPSYFFQLKESNYCKINSCFEGFSSLFILLGRYSTAVYSFTV